MTMRNMTMTRLRRCAGWALAAFALLAVESASAADGYRYTGGRGHYSGGGYSGGGSHGGGGSYHGGGHGGHGGGHHTSKPPKTSSKSTSSGRRFTYRNGYRDGGSGYSWLSFRRGENSRNGYTGPNTHINTPHRSDWNAKLKAQRRWDEAQYKQAQQARGAECGFTTSPDYCYRLQAPYPSEMRIVRY